jgi:hypothetical protein
MIEGKVGSINGREGRRSDTRSVLLYSFAAR